MPAPEAKHAAPRLVGKVAIVTGAGATAPGNPESAGNPGTGQATAILFARHGARVLLVDRSEANARVTLQAIEQEGGQASVFIADVTSSPQCKAMVDAALKRFGGLHVLFNNVGIAARGTVVDLDEELLDRTLDINLKSMVLTSKHAVPAMARGGGGSIINIASVDGMRAGSTQNIPYAVSKGGVIALTTCMAVHHGRQGVRTNCISPGHIHAAMVEKLVNPEQRELRRRAAPLGTEGNAWDVAWAAVFLASDESRWINGVNLPIDAGLLATTPLSALPFFRDDGPSARS